MQKQIRAAERFGKYLETIAKVQFYNNDSAFFVSSFGGDFIAPNTILCHSQIYYCASNSECSSLIFNLLLAVVVSSVCTRPK